LSAAKFGELATSKFLRSSYKATAASSQKP